MGSNFSCCSDGLTPVLGLDFDLIIILEDRKEEKTIRVNANDHVGDVLKKAKWSFSLPQDKRVHLIKSDQIMDEAKTLKEYDIVSKQKLRLIGKRGRQILDDVHNSELIDNDDVIPEQAIIL